MFSIGIIATDAAVYAKSLELCAELGLKGEAELREGVLEEALAIAGDMVARGADVIVSRGATVEMIEGSGLPVPVVNIPLSVQDISSMLGEARAVTGLERPRMAVVCYSGLDLDLQSLARILDIDLRVYKSGSSRDSIEQAARAAAADGADVLIGGRTTRAALEKIGGGHTRFARYVSGEASIRQALQEARRVALARKMEQQRAGLLRAVVDLSRDGIVTVDARGLVTMANPPAIKMLGLPRAPVGLPLADICPLPEFSALPEARLADELAHCNGQPLLVDAAPIMVQGRAAGAVVNCRRVRHIVELEAKIRKKLSARGLAARHTFADITGNSPPIRAAVELAARYAEAESPVLILGATGTGKELFAQAMHNAGPRRQGPFVAVNCAALPPSLLESELFGYEEGAFTGASRGGKTGLFELAHQGTIFLDEVSGMDHYGQMRLLRVLQEKSVMRLGGDRFLPVDFRVMAASNVDLRDLAAIGAFREDLFYRLNCLPLNLPPLRERRGDIAALAALFLGPGAPAPGPEALAELEAYHWPGNVRELRSCVERLKLLAGARPISAALAREALADAAGRRAGRPDAALASPQGAAGAENSERERLIAALRRCNGRQGRAAALLGMDKSTLYRKMKKLNIRRDVFY